VNHRAAALSLAFVALAAAAPALAQDVPPVAAPDPNAAVAADDGSDNFTLGLGVGYAPSYEGSNNYVISPAGVVRGRVSGFNFYSRATALYVDLVREAPGAALNIEAGPMVNLRLDRSARIRDDRVKALGEIDTAVEAGGFIGVTKNGVLHGYDFATVRLDVTKDVADAHDGVVITPNFEYATPLSTSFLVGVSLSAEHVSGKFADTYYSIGPAGTLASGLATYDADGGWKNVRGTLLATYSLSGDLRRGAAIFAVGSYSKLLGDFKRSPIVRDAGDKNQFFAALGLSYTF
jgi:outer membrane scaffolding protein for murein synthesis (MipA/OmpV family)